MRATPGRRVSSSFTDCSGHHSPDFTRYFGLPEGSLAGNFASPFRRLRFHGTWRAEFGLPAESVFPGSREPPIQSLRRFFVRFLCSRKKVFPKEDLFIFGEQRCREQAGIHTFLPQESRKSRRDGPSAVLKADTSPSVPITIRIMATGWVVSFDLPVEEEFQGRQRAMHRGFDNESLEGRGSGARRGEGETKRSRSMHLLCLSRNIPGKAGPLLNRLQRIPPSIFYGRFLNFPKPSGILLFFLSMPPVSGPVLFENPSGKRKASGQGGRDGMCHMDRFPVPLDQDVGDPGPGLRVKPLGPDTRVVQAGQPGRINF